jgi:hypothetical protein
MRAEDQSWKVFDSARQCTFAVTRGKENGQPRKNALCEVR